MTSVLVVEDEQWGIEAIYVPAFEGKNVSVSFVTNERDAIELIKCKYFDVAFVDLMLRKENITEDAGIDVIKYLHTIGDPTSIVVVSGTSEVDHVLHAHRARIDRFVRKIELFNPADDIYLIFEEMLKNQRNAQRRMFGHFNSLTNYLAHPEETGIWEFRWIQQLGSDYTNFTAALNNSLLARLPIIRLKGNVQSLYSGLTQRSAYGYFWSRGIGKPIMISLAFVEGELPAPRSEYTFSKVYENSLRNVRVAVYVIESGIARSLFLDSVYD